MDRNMIGWERVRERSFGFELQLGFEFGFDLGSH